MGYTTEKNTQILIGLLKYHGIKRIIVNPGANNVSFVGSVQQDSYFDICSVVDERSAVYIACGMATESGEPVAVVCTGATASRNYFSGLTEAYYSHVPVLAITYTQPISRIGHNVPQVIDRTVVSNDIVKISECIPMVKDADDERDCNIRINRALLELKHGIPGPIHLNVETKQSGTFSAEECSGMQPIDRIVSDSAFPKPAGKVAVFVGYHKKWDSELESAVDEFCEKYNAVVISDQTGNYKGRFRYNAAFASVQQQYVSENLKADTLIHLGDISGAYFKVYPKEVWRVSPDGAICDSFKKLRYVFEMSECEFFKKMNAMKDDASDCSYLKACREEVNRIKSKLPELPFSNLWVAGEIAKRIPENCGLHLGILNSLRSWNFADIPDSVDVYANTGGFGIDGCVSSLVGAGIAAPQKLFFGAVGDLAFFYDMNVLGNRHIGKNIRLLVVNNGLGQEFKNYGHRAAQFGEGTNPYIAAQGHNGRQSKELLKNYATDLGFEYMSAQTKEEVLSHIERFTTPDQLDKPVVFEVFTDSKEETEAIRKIGSVEYSASHHAKGVMKKLLGEKGVNAVKKLAKK